MLIVIVSVRYEDELDGTYLSPDNYIDEQEDKIHHSQPSVQPNYAKKYYEWEWDFKN